MVFEIIEVKSKQHYGMCAALRTLVYVMEQDCPLLVEFDDLEEQATDFLAFEDDVPVGTIRYRLIDAHTGKLERLVLLSQARGKGYSKQLIQRILDELSVKQGVNHIVLSSQDYIIPLYEGFGFQVVGDGYLEAGIAHHKMVLDL